MPLGGVSRSAFSPVSSCGKSLGCRPSTTIMRRITLPPQPLDIRADAVAHRIEALHRLKPSQQRHRLRKHRCGIAPTIIINGIDGSRLDGGWKCRGRFGLHCNRACRRLQGVLPHRFSAPSSKTICSRMIASAIVESGTMCCLPFFTRAAGMIQTFASRSSSSACIPTTSPMRCPVTRANRRACRVDSVMPAAGRAAHIMMISAAVSTRSRGAVTVGSACAGQTASRRR
jgi:hypothetical protein